MLTFRLDHAPRRDWIDRRPDHPDTTTYSRTPGALLLDDDGTPLVVLPNDGTMVRWVHVATLEPGRVRRGHRMWIPPTDAARYAVNAGAPAADLEARRRKGWEP